MKLITKLIQVVLETLDIDADQLHSIEFMQGPGPGWWFVDVDMLPGSFIEVDYIRGYGLGGVIHEYQKISGA